MFEAIPHFKIVPMLPEKGICCLVANIIPELYYLYPCAKMCLNIFNKFLFYFILFQQRNPDVRHVDLEIL